MQIKHDDITWNAGFCTQRAPMQGVHTTIRQATVVSINELLHLVLSSEWSEHMPRFYLNPIFSGRPIRDHDGEDHPGLDDARRSAISSGREILAYQLRGDEVSFRGVEIADQNGVILEVIGISEILRGPVECVTRHRHKRNSLLTGGDRKWSAAMKGDIEMEAQMSGDQPSACDRPARDARAKPINLGFIGLGQMGLAMAANLAATGHRVVGHVRHPDRAAELAGLGILPTTEVQSLYNCDIVITMLPDDVAVRNVVFGRTDLGIVGLASGLKRGAVHLCMATISTLMALQLATAHARCGQGYVAAPVFGNPEAAKARQLFILAAGAELDVERCRPLFDALGQKMFSISAEPWQANLIKLLGNMMTATALEMMAELVTVARKRGLDPEIFIDIMTSTMFGGRAHKTYGDKIVSQSYAPGFVLPLVLKDVKLALAEADYAGAPMPSVNVVRDRLITGIARGYAGLDWTALGLIAGEAAGLAANNPVVLD